MRRLRMILALGCLALAGSSSFAAEVFIAKPYLQLGDAPTSTSGDLDLLWHADDADADWTVEYRAGSDPAWKKAEAPRAEGRGRGASRRTGSIGRP